MSTPAVFRSEERFTRGGFRRWVDRRPLSDINHYELIQGRIVMTPPAGSTHARIDATLTALLYQHVSRSDLGIVFGSSAGFDLPSGDTLEPDVAYVSHERLAAAPSAGPDQFVRAVPNLVVEILSPSTARRDQTEKKAIYERNGVDEYWIVDPRQRVVTVFVRSTRGYDAGRAFRRGIVRSRALPRLRVSIEKLFGT